MQIAVVLVLMVAAAALFCLESVPVELVALGVLVVLLLTGILTPAEALSGFASEAVVVIGGLFVLTAGLRASGALDGLVLWAQRAAAGAPSRALALLLSAVAAVSAFLSNTTCTAAFLPVGVALAKGGGLRASRVLMPMAFASILGGSITLFGTSTNLIVSGFLRERGMAPLGMFELLPVALPIAALGLVYLVAASRRLLPERGDEREMRHAVRAYLTEATVTERSALCGRSVGDADLARRWDMSLVAIVRRGEALAPRPDEVLVAGDVLLLEGTSDALLRLGGARGLEVPARRPADRGIPESRGLQLAEAVVLPRSELVGRTLREARFRQRFGANVIALSRHGEPVVEQLGRVVLRVGDVLLIHGAAEEIEGLSGWRGLVVLSHRPTPRRPASSAWVAAATFALVIVLASTGTVGLVAAVLAGCLVLFASRCLTPPEAYAALEWRLLILVAGMMAYGQALEKTGAAALLAASVVERVGGLGPLAVLAAFYLLTMAFTQPMSNQAAALLVLPIALETARAAAVEPRAVAVTVALAASSSFLTPLEPSCLLVYGPGRYRFFDYPRLGAGLTLLALVLTLLLVPVFWPLGGGSAALPVEWPTVGECRDKEMGR